MEFLQEELDEILNIFSQEGSEILESMDKNLLLLEKKPNNLDVAMHLFRDAHSLKGSARMLGFNGIQDIAHKIEDVLGLIREGKLTPTSDITDAISDALSLIEVLIKKTVEQKTEYVSDETKEHIKKLESICEKSNDWTGENKQNEKEEKLLEIEDKTNKKNLKEAELFELISKIKITVPEINNNKHSLAEAKSLLNELISRLKDDSFKKIYEIVLQIISEFEESEEKIEKDTMDALIEIFEATEGILESRLSKNVYNDFTEEIELLSQKALIISQMVKYELQNPGAKTRQQKPLSSLGMSNVFDSTSIKTLRVNSDKLDKLVNQVGNLIITRIKSHENVGIVKILQEELIELQKYYHKIGYYMKFYEKKYVQEALSDSESIQKKDSFLGYNKQLLAFHNANTEKMNSILSGLNFLMKELQENNIKLNTATAEIESMVKSMRVLPLSAVFNLFPRMVHNIAKEKNKEIELLIEGEDISVDKKIIEDIKIPIMHIVRNSLDHGIETPRERENKGKPKTGSILIKAVQKENKIVISIKDDGRGINIQKIKQKAVEKGFLTQEAADNMSKEQLANFIFYPGFSTGDTVTELSGRGLGLDIVHTKISQLNGRIDVYSEENKGTVVAMELPTSMATIKAFIIKEEDRLLAIPAVSIETVLRISKEDIQERNGKNYFIYNNEAVLICSLSSILNLKHKDDNQDKYTIMIIKSESATIGVIVQKLIGDEEILNKKLPEPMLRVKNISGITTLANGEMCLLLNVADILNASKMNKLEFTPTKSLTLKDNSKYKILIVDDSVTTRRLLNNVLTSKGYITETMPDVRSALRILELRSFNLIITDYEMPSVNGFEFIKELREKDNTKNTPVVMITSIEQKGLKEEVAKYGVVDFIKKEYFEQNEFLKIVDKNLSSIEDKIS